MKWVQFLGRMEQNRFPKLLSNYKPKGKRDQTSHVKDWEESFEYNTNNFIP